MCTWGAMQRNGLKRLRHHLTSAMPGCSGSSSSTHSPPDKCAYSRQLSTQRPPDVVFQEMGRAVSVGKTALPVATAAALLNLLGLHSCYSRSGLLLGKAPQSSWQNAQQHNVQTLDAPRLAPYTSGSTTTMEQLVTSEGFACADAKTDSQDAEPGPGK